MKTEYVNVVKATSKSHNSELPLALAFVWLAFASRISKLVIHDIHDFTVYGLTDD